MEIETHDYYALVNYRGKVKYYYVGKALKDDIRVSYIDYKPGRHDGVWITNGKSKIVKKFEKGSVEYEYFDKLIAKFRMLVEKLAEEKRASAEDKNLPDIFYFAGIGTYYIRKAYKEAYSTVKKPDHVSF